MAACCKDLTSLGTLQSAPRLEREEAHRSLRFSRSLRMMVTSHLCQHQKACHPQPRQHLHSSNHALPRLVGLQRLALTVVILVQIHLDELNLTI